MKIEDTRREGTFGIDLPYYIAQRMGVIYYIIYTASIIVYFYKLLYEKTELDSGYPHDI